MGRVAVVVLGDVGRSPRMQYHVGSLARECAVDVVGYSGSSPREDLVQNKKVTFTYIREFPRLSRKLFLFYAPFKVLFLVLQLFYITLFKIKKPDAILVQNPPAIPTLFVIWIVCKFRGAKFGIDWHNFGYSILQISMSPKHPFVILYKFYEKIFGKMGDYHFCVSHAMADELYNWGIGAEVLYDRPPAFFKRLKPGAEMHNLFTDLQKDFEDVAKDLGIKLDKNTTLFTRKTKDGDYIRHEERPALIVSSTSWTPDEDFGVLLNAILELEKNVVEKIKKNTLDKEFPKMVFVITGKGPQKEYYLEKIATLDLEYSYVKTMWLTNDDYPRILGSADLGVSLHTSSSGVDLPMKVVDMFGCELPVCAFDYRTLSELVNHGHNGYAFKDSAQLADQLFQLFHTFPSDRSLLKSLKGKEPESDSKFKTWQQNWTSVAWPIFSGLLS